MGMISTHINRNFWENGTLKFFRKRFEMLPDIIDTTVNWILNQWTYIIKKCISWIASRLFTSWQRLGNKRENEEITR